MAGNRIIDMHAHIFPDGIAQKAADSIAGFYDMPARYNGTVHQLLQRYDHAGVGTGCVYSVAITPHYIASINRFVSETAQKNAGKLIGFAAIHPDDPDIPALIRDVQSKQLKGFKIHPDMQRFALDDPKAMDMFAAIEGKLPIIVHMGDPRFAFSHPRQMKKVLESFPKLVCVCAHLGGWSEWDDAWKTLSSYPNVYVDTSSSLYAMTPEEGRSVIRKYSGERVMFGTDYPMWDPKEELERLKKLRLSDREMENILYRNAETFLGLS